MFADEFYELVDPVGNRYVMHTAESGTLDLSSGDHCYHNVLRDNLGQGYHQYVFDEENYP